MEAARAVAVDTVAPADVERAVAVIVLAFSADPVARWAYPDPRQYLTLLPPLVRAFDGKAFAEGTAHHVNSSAGAALWLPPGIDPDQAALEATLPVGREAELTTVFEEMARHHPSEPHRYLPLIGIDPTHQRQGCGAALLRETLRRCGRDHLPAYLEATNPANIKLYQAHGFEVLGTVQAGSSPPLFPMLRATRA
jgi:ribosomal protein S18 acetylase RimI-like enzyme